MFSSNPRGAQTGSNQPQHFKKNNRFNNNNYGGSNSNARNNPRSNGGFNSTAGNNPRSTGGVFGAQSSSSQTNTFNKDAGPKFVGDRNSGSSMFRGNNPRSSTGAQGGNLNWGSSSQPNPRSSNFHSGHNQTSSGIQSNSRTSNYNYQNTKQNNYESKNPREKQNYFNQSNSNQSFGGLNQNSPFNNSINQKSNPRSGMQTSFGLNNQSFRSGGLGLSNSSENNFNSVQNSGFQNDSGFFGRSSQNQRFNQPSNSNQSMFQDQSNTKVQTSMPHKSKIFGGDEMDMEGNQTGTINSHFGSSQSRVNSQSNGPILTPSITQGKSGSIFGDKSSKNNKQQNKLDALLNTNYQSTNQSNSTGKLGESKGTTCDNSDPPKQIVTPIMQLLMDMGYECLMSKPYSDENAELDGENVLSYNPPTLKQIKKQ